MGTHGPKKNLPRDRLASSGVRGLLRECLYNRVSGPEYFITSFRAVWRNTQAQNLEEVWEGIVQYRLDMDTVVQRVSSPLLVVSAITATMSNHRTWPGAPIEVFPALAYWVVARPGTLNEANLFEDLRQVGPGAAVSHFKQRQVTQGSPIDHNFALLCLVVKDHGKGYVRNRVDTSELCCGVRRKQHPIVKIVVRDKSLFASLMKAQQAFSMAGFSPEFSFAE